MKMYRIIAPGRPPYGGAYAFTLEEAKLVARDISEPWTAVILEVDGCKPDGPDGTILDLNKVYGTGKLIRSFIY